MQRPIAAVVAIAAALVFGISSVADQRSTKRVRSRKGFSAAILVDLVGVAAATAGVAGFLAIGQPSAGHSSVGFSILLPLAIGLVVVVGGSLAVGSRNQNLQPLALALACGVCYGVSAFAVKLVTTEFGTGAVRVFTNWPIYLLAVVGPAGFILRH